jgi:hypothetical protein
MGDFMIARGLTIGMFATVFLISATQAQAQWSAEKRVRDVGVRTIERAIQCEIGHFAREVLKSKITITPERSLALYSISEKIETAQGYGASVKLGSFFNAGGNYNQNATVEDSIDFDPYAISVKNEAACSKRDDALVLLDLRDCLARVADVYDHSSFKCNAQINVRKDLSGGVGIPIYLVSIGPNASWGAEYSQGVKVVAPKPALGH